MNSFNFTGNLGNDCEQRYSQNGDPITSFSVAVKSGYGDKAVTTWVRCTMFGKRGEAVAPYLTKGQLVGVSGEFAAREWTDKEGMKRTSIEVRVVDLTLLGKRDDSQEVRHHEDRKRPGSAIKNDYARESQSAHEPAFDDDSTIPF